MKLQYLDCVDWEPATLRLQFSERETPSAKELHDRISQWFREEQPQQGCSCSLTFLHVEMDDLHSATLICEWLCRQCVPALVQWVDAEPGQLERVDVGLASVEPPDSGFVSVPAGTVEFEDGRSVQVPAFSVSTNPVQVGQYQRFVDETGYQTTAQRDDSCEHFGENSLLHGLSRKAADKIPVAYVSWHDCLAYCRWAKVRLPTEAEWLAASLADDRIYTKNGYMNEVFPLKTAPRFLKDLSTEWTASFDVSGLAIVRRGPRWARTSAWKEEVIQHRFLVNPNDYDVMTSFRVAVSGAAVIGSAGDG